jgi:hypothetical protein
MSVPSRLDGLEKEEVLSSLLLQLFDEVLLSE